jgi:hypothetical protein
MACPYFMPRERAAQATGQPMPPAPLGDTWSGFCCAGPGEWQPDAHTVEQLCNFGYARDRCARLPADAPDAVRFSISHDQDGLIRIYWVMEKAHLPFAHGSLEYSPGTMQFHPTHPDACVAGQAQAYVSSYLRRKGESVRSCR